MIVKYKSIERIFYVFHVNIHRGCQDENIGKPLAVAPQIEKNRTILFLNCPKMGKLTIAAPLLPKITLQFSSKIPEKPHKVHRTSGDVVQSRSCGTGSCRPLMFLYIRRSYFWLMFYFHYYCFTKKYNWSFIYCKSVVFHFFNYFVEDTFRNMKFLFGNKNHRNRFSYSCQVTNDTVNIFHFVKGIKSKDKINFLCQADCVFLAIVNFN